MVRPSELLIENFHLQLDESWRVWFDEASKSIKLHGFFRSPVDVAGLCNHKPESIWAGFMLPDTIPVLGNGYGDWICARVDSGGNLAELIHWYHGGGDWISLGPTLAEAILHDCVDVHRPVRRQMLRGAVETARNKDGSPCNYELKSWINAALKMSAATATANPAAEGNAVLARNELEHSEVSSDQAANFDRLKMQAESLDPLWQAIEAADYTLAIETLLRFNLAYDAAVCDRIEQSSWSAGPVDHLTNQSLSETEFATIESLCRSVIARRSDLGWSFGLLGWLHVLRGEIQTACQIFFDGRHASAFSDQSVRMRLHRFDQRYGKFSLAQLAAHRAQLPKPMQEDEYVQLILQDDAKNRIQSIHDFWMSRAQHALSRGQPAEAYRCAYNAGWDVGSASMLGYRKLLMTLEQSASECGWQARAATARAHLSAL